MASPLLLDTDILIDYLRGVPAAIEWVENSSERMLVSAATVGELFAGVRDGKEKVALGALLMALEVVPIDVQIATTGGLIRRDFGRSHGTGFNDAMIAATAHYRAARLVTLNRRHFPMVPDILVPYEKG